MWRDHLRPRDTMLPGFLAGWAVWVLPAGVFASLVDHDRSCPASVPGCPGGLLEALLWVAFLGVPLAYVTAVVVTAASARLGATERYPGAFEPPTAVRTALLAVAGLALVASLALGQRLLVTGVGAALAYTLLFPPLAWTVLVVALAPPVPGSLAAAVTVLGVGLLLLVPWWYLLAYALVGAGERLRRSAGD